MVRSRIGCWLVIATLACVGSLSTLTSAGAAEAVAPSTAGVPSTTPVSAVTDNDIIAFIDEQIRQGWKDSGLAPSTKATDAEWCRRVYLDILGRIPTVEELTRYLATPGDKRSKLIDQLLNSDQYVEEYARNQTTLWSILLVGRPPARRENRDMVNREGMNQFLRRSFLENKPYDKFVYDIVSASGNTKPGEPDFNGATNFYVNKLLENATEATSKTAKIFLGLQVQCTQCHNHPFNDWKQEQFWGFNAFFRQTRAMANRAGRDVDNTVLINEDFAGEGNNPKEAEIYYELRNGVLQAAWPTFVDGTKIDPSGYVSDVNRRAELARLITKSDLMSKAIVNRMWGHFLGYGFTKPVDDMGPHNPPSHPELLDRLGTEFAARGYDLKRLIKWITLSEAYSLSSRVGPKNRKDDPTMGEKPMFSHFYVRQMQAEQLYESLLVSTGAGNQGTYEQREATKAMWLTQFTVAFGNDEGEETTTFNGTIPQALMMMNGELIKEATKCEPGTFLHRVFTSPTKDTEKIEYLYLQALARKPSTQELAAARSLIVARGDMQTALQDIWWALLNSNEFIFVH